MKLTYDQDADALYIHLIEGGIVSRTQQIEDGTLVDLDESARVLGIEILRPAREWPLEEVASQFQIDQHDLAALEEMQWHPNRPFSFTPNPLVGV